MYYLFNDAVSSSNYMTRRRGGEFQSRLLQ